MGTRDSAIARACADFDNGTFRDRLAGLVAVRSTSQDPGHEADVRAYLEAHMRPWLEGMGFAVAVADNPRPGFGPILTTTLRGFDPRPRIGPPEGRVFRPHRDGGLAAPSGFISVIGGLLPMAPCGRSSL